ncbi:hypothetical protein BLOT_012240 [Blomia tropicalis]|nr:hypothetical protein BLOT_012240 [Blomia tropicalis]
MKRKKNKRRHPSLSEQVTALLVSCRFNWYLIVVVVLLFFVVVVVAAAAAAAVAAAAAAASGDDGGGGDILNGSYSCVFVRWMVDLTGLEGADSHISSRVIHLK